MCETLDFVENRGFKRGEEHGIQLGRQQLRAELDLAAAYLRETGRKDELSRLIDDDEFCKKILEEYKKGKGNE